MARKHPKARRATALTLLTSSLLVLAAANAVALHPTPASAGSSGTSTPIVPGHPRLLGDPNTPDEGRGGGGSTITTSTSPSTSPARTFFDWVKGLAHHYFLPSH